MQADQDLFKSLAVLSKFLGENKSKNQFGMNITMAQGLLYAINSSPCLIMPRDWMFVVFGGIPSFQSMAHQKEVFVETLALHSFIENRLLSSNPEDLFIWQEGGRTVNLNAANNSLVVDFCIGYVKGYLLDPILKETFDSLPDLSLSFFLSLIKLGSEGENLDNLDTPKEVGPINIDDDMRKALQHLLVENYVNWLEIRKLNLAKTYFNKEKLKE